MRVCACWHVRKHIRPGCVLAFVRTIDIVVRLEVVRKEREVSLADDYCTGRQ